MNFDDHLAIAGLQRSGTNFVEQIIRNNFKRIFFDANFPKHFFPDEISNAIINSRKIILVTRHPVMWLHSCLENEPADLHVLRRDYFQESAPEIALARLYNRFYAEWIDYIGKSGGVHVRYEDLLRGDLQPFVDLVPSVNEDGAFKTKAELDFSRVPHSIDFTPEDRNRALRLECPLAEAQVNRFHAHLSTELLGEIGYRLDDIRFVKQKPARSIAYLLLRRPQEVSEDDLRTLTDVAAVDFSNNGSILHAIGLRLARGGKPAEAVDWHQRSIEAWRRGEGVDADSIEAFLAALDALEQIVSLQTVIEAAPGQDSRPGQVVDKGEFLTLANAVATAFAGVVKQAATRGASADELASLHFFMSRILDKTGRVDDTTAHAGQAVALSPNHGHYLQHLADLVSRQGRLEDAEALLRRAIALEPGAVRHHVVLSHVLSRMDRIEEALAVAGRALELAGPEPGLLHHQGQLLIRLGRFAEAETSLRRATVFEPANAHHRQVLSGVLLSQGRLDEAAAEAAEAVACENTEPWHLHHLGVLLAAQGRHEEAEARLRQAARLEPYDAQHHFALSQALVRQGRPAEALEAAAQAVRCENRTAWHHHHHGVLQAGAGRLDEAEVSLGEAVAVDPGQWRSHIELSDVLARQGRTGEAFLAAEAAIARGGDEARVFGLYGRLLARQGRFTEAAAHLGHAWRIGPRRAGWRIGTALRHAAILWPALVRFRLGKG